MLSTDDHLRRLKLIEGIKKTFKEDYEYFQLLEIIKKNEITFSENINGCFIDLREVSNDIVNELEKILKMCEDKYKRKEQIKQSIKQARNYNNS